MSRRDLARLYANENFPAQVVRELRTLGHDVLTVRESGKDEQRFPDEAVLAFATTQGRAVLTLNRRHFIRLHESNVSHAGIVVCTFDPDFLGQAVRINDAIAQHVVLCGLLLRVNRPLR